jgi:hypothetical protein
VISFVEKAWFVWWMVATVLAVRWFHVLAIYSGSPNAFMFEDDPQISGPLGQKAQPVSSPEMQRALRTVHGCVYDLRSGKLTELGDATIVGNAD